MTNTRTLWISLAALLVASFAVLLAMGGEIYRKAPPLPDRVVAEDGSLIYDGAEIQRGRQVWQSIGGMQLGSIWGHGGYVAPDWSADWLHREAMAVLDLWAQREDAGGNVRRSARRAARGTARPARDADAREYLRCRDAHDHARRRSRRGDRAGRARTTKACSAATPPRPRCARRTR